MLLLVTIYFLYLITPFVYPIFWAAVIAALFHPVFKRIDHFVNHRNLSTIITLSLIAVIIILPVVILTVILANEALSIYSSFGTIGHYLTEALIKTSDFLEHNALTARLNINSLVINENFSRIGGELVTSLIGSATSFIQNSLAFLAFLFLLFYTMFFFIRDGEQFLKKIFYLLPLGAHNEALLYTNFTSTASATIRGTLFLGGLQGLMGGILFAACGIPSPAVWGILMFVFSVIPATGTFFVWLPAGIIMLFSGHLWQGVTILLVGSLVITMIDNFLRPIVIGKGIQMHPLIILFSTLGGLLLFNISGFVIGPIVAALFLSFWQMYESYYHAELNKL